MKLLGDEAVTKTIRDGRQTESPPATARESYFGQRHRLSCINTSDCQMQIYYRHARAGMLFHGQAKMAYCRTSSDHLLRHIIVRILDTVAFIVEDLCQAMTVMAWYIVDPCHCQDGYRSQRATLRFENLNWARELGRACQLLRSFLVFEQWLPPLHRCANPSLIGACRSWALRAFI